jgi:hypothetical protein
MRRTALFPRWPPSSAWHDDMAAGVCSTLVLALPSLLLLVHCTSRWAEEWQGRSTYALAGLSLIGKTNTMT